MRSCDKLLVIAVNPGVQDYHTWRQVQPVAAFTSTSSMGNSEDFFRLWILRIGSLIAQVTNTEELVGHLVEAAPGM